MTFPSTDASPIQFTAALPKECDVVVIGGGIIGVMAAWYLAKAGQRVVLVEKGRIAGEQSSRNWGWVRQQGRDPAELPIMIEANRIWQSLSAEAGEDLGFRQCGVLYLANTAKDMADYEAWLAHARDHQLDSRLLTRSEVQAMIPTARADWPGALWTASDGRAEPWHATPALARAAVRKGAIIREQCAARSLDIAGGRVAGVITEAGRIACGQVILAGGAWSSLFARAHGVRFPQLSARATVAATVPMPEVFAGNAADNHFAFRRRADGGYSIALGSYHDFYIGPDAFRHLGAFYHQLKKEPFASRYRLAAPKGYPDGWSTPRHWAADAPSPFEATRILDPAPSRHALRQMVALFGRTFPHLGPPKLAATWAGMIDSLPDKVPVIDHVPAVPGLILATGMSGHGFGIAPAFGRILADLATGRAPGHDMRAFRFTRFSDGSILKPGAAL